MTKAIPYLPQEYLDNCKVLSNRFEMLDLLPKNGTYAEVGVLHGDYSEEILKRCNPERLYLIDLFLMYDRHYEDIKNKFYPKNNVNIQEGFSWEVLSEFPDKYFDFIYIDAGHSYKDVKRDAMVARHKIKDDGYLIFNDYILYNNFAKEVEEFGVCYVVHELCLKHDYEFKYLALHPYLFNDVCLRKRGIDG